MNQNNPTTPIRASELSLTERTLIILDYFTSPEMVDFALDVLQGTLNLAGDDDAACHDAIWQHWCEQFEQISGVTYTHDRLGAL